MLARGSNHKKTAKFNSLPILKTAAITPIVAALITACGSQQVKEPEEFGFESAPAAVDVQPAPVAATPVAPKPTAKKPAAKPHIISIRDGAPSRYTVKRGDTLWDISKKFLNEPWLWPEVWYFNPQIVNPHLIYPGDELVMSYVGNRPQIRVNRADGSSSASYIGSTNGVVKLSPRVRREAINSAIPTVPIKDIRAFLESARVVTDDEIEALPVVIGSLDDHLISGPSTTIYARGLEANPEQQRYEIIRKGRPFRSLSTNELLGYEALEVGSAKLTAGNNENDISTFKVVTSKREILRYDLLAKNSADDITTDFIPSAPNVDIKGNIIALHNAISNVAGNQVVIVDVGSRDGLEAGNILAIDQAGEVVRERIPGTTRTRNVQLPDVRAGLALVFRVFDRVSYALIVDSNRAIHISDRVRNPQFSQDL